MRREWAEARRLVVKIGSSLLAERDTGALKTEWLASLGRDIASLRERNRQVIIVSSGSIALGRRVLRLPPGGLRLEESQAAAAVGQIDLAHAYEEVLKHHGLVAAQVLLTLGDTEERRRYLNARNTVETLLRLGAVPVVNENDTVATSEIRYGDNDRLAARVASMTRASTLRRPRRSRSRKLSITAASSSGGSLCAASSVAFGTASEFSDGRDGSQRWRTSISCRSVYGLLR